MVIPKKVEKMKEGLFRNGFLLIYYYFTPYGYQGPRSLSKVILYTLANIPSQYWSVNNDGTIWNGTDIIEEDNPGYIATFGKFHVILSTSNITYNND